MTHDPNFSASNATGSRPGVAASPIGGEEEVSQAANRESILRVLIRKLFRRPPKLKATQPVGRARVGARKRASGSKLARFFAMLCSLGCFGRRRPSRRAEASRASFGMDKANRWKGESREAKSQGARPHKKHGLQTGSKPLSAQSVAAETLAADPLVSSQENDSASLDANAPPQQTAPAPKPKEQEEKPSLETVVQPAENKKASVRVDTGSKKAFVAPPTPQQEKVLDGEQVAKSLNASLLRVQSVTRKIVGDGGPSESVGGLYAAKLEQMKQKEQVRPDENSPSNLFERNAKTFRDRLIKAQDCLSKAADKVRDGSIDCAGCINFEQELNNQARDIERYIRKLYHYDSESAELSQGVVKDLRAAAKDLSRLNIRKGPSMDSAQWDENLSRKLGWQNFSNRMADMKERLLGVEAGQRPDFVARYVGRLSISFDKHKIDQPAKGGVNSIAEALGNAIEDQAGLSRLAANLAKEKYDYHDRMDYVDLMGRVHNKEIGLSGYDARDHYNLLVQDLRKQAGELDVQIALLEKREYTDLVKRLELETYSGLLKDSLKGL